MLNRVSNQAIAGLLFVVAVIAAVIGWFMNLFKIVGGFESMAMSELIVRIAGLPVAPLGAIIGYF